MNIHFPIPLLSVVTDHAMCGLDGKTNGGGPMPILSRALAGVMTGR